jgi:hypothetical protein
MLAYAPTMDRAVQEFRFRSGAKNTYWIDQLVKYVKAQGLWDAFRIYPMQYRTNAQTGSVCYGLGGLTSNEMTLVNGPTWGAGIDFTVATSYAKVTIPGFKSLTDGLVFTRFEPQAASSADGTTYNRWWFGDLVATRYLASSTSTASLSGEKYTSFQNNGATGRTGSSGASWTAGEDFTEVCEFGTFGSGAAVYKNKTAFAMNSSVGSQVFTPNATGYVADDEIVLSAIKNAGISANLTGVYKAYAVITGTVTDTQRETITDYINLIGTPPPDADVQEFAQRSGATDILAITQLVQYAKQEGLWGNLRVYPMVGGTNAGTGATAYGLGGLTANEMTLVNGPTWGASGLAFNSGSSQYGSISDFLASAELHVFARTTHTDVTTGFPAVYGQYDYGTDDRSFLLAQDGGATDDPWETRKSSDGSNGNQETYNGTKTGAGSDTCMVAHWSDSERNLYANKTAISLSLVAGSDQATRQNASCDFTYNALLSSGTAANFSDQTAHALAFLTGTVTTTQRETITDLINAL